MMVTRILFKVLILFLFIFYFIMVKSFYKSLTWSEKEILRKATCLLRFRKEFPKIGDKTYFSYN